jgi:hypothetical protein
MRFYATRRAAEKGRPVIRDRYHREITRYGITCSAHMLLMPALEIDVIKIMWVFQPLNGTMRTLSWGMTADRCYGSVVLG